MYKKTLPSLLLICSSALSFGQSTLTASNFNPVVGNEFAVAVCNTAGVTAGISGANIIWNFTTLGTTSMDTGYAISCTSATPSCASFVGSNIVVSGPAATHTTNYFYEDAGKLSLFGYSVGTGAADTMLVLTDAADKFHYPLNYLDTFADTYAGMVTFGTTTAHENGLVTVKCDGYGTLQLPSRTDYNVLRVHTLQSFVDSASLFGFPVVKTFLIESYDWYKPWYHAALLTINTVTDVTVPTAPVLVTKFVAYASLQISGVNDLSNNSLSLDINPNPATDKLNIDFDVKSNEHIRIALYDIMGREVAVIADKNLNGQQHITYNASTLPKGLYLVRVQSGTETTTKKIELQ